jgi:SAM-dependent methyltransferase
MLPLLELDPVAGGRAALEAMLPWHRTRFPNWEWPLLHPYAREYAWAVAQLGAVGGQRILDAGGSGSALSAVLAEAGAAFVLVVDRGDQGLRPYPAPRVGFLAGDLRATELEPASFDAVVSVSAVEHNPWGDQVVILRHLLELVKPGGKVVITLPAVAEQDRAWYAAGQWPGHPNWGCVYLWTASAVLDMVRALEDVGELLGPVLAPADWDREVARLFLDMDTRAPKPSRRPYLSMGLTWRRK